MDDILVAGEKLTPDIEKDLWEGLLARGLKVREDKTQRMFPIKYLGTLVEKHLIRLQKVILADTAVTTLNDFQVLIGAIQWLQQFVPLVLVDMKILTKDLKGDTDVAAP